MGHKEVWSRQGVASRAWRWVGDLMLRGWVFEFWGLLVLSAVFQWWGPYIWKNPKTVEAVVSGISSIPLLGAMFYLWLAVSTLWFVAAIFDIDEYYLPVLDWFATTVRTYTIAVAAVVFGSVWPWTWDKATAINLIAIVFGGTWCAIVLHTVNDRRNHLQTSGRVVVKSGCAMLANCGMAALAVLFVWLLQVFPQVIDSAH